MINKEFERQLKRNLSTDIFEFNSNPLYTEIRGLYKINYDTIKKLIDRVGPKLAIEDISNLDSSLASLVIENILLLKEINRAIIDGELTADQIS